MKTETTISRANLATLPTLDPERRRFVAAASLLALGGCGGGSTDDDPDRAGETADAGRDAKSDPALAPEAALAVVSSVPGDGGNNQPRTRQPSFTFSSLLNAASVNGGNFSLRAGEATVPAAIRVIDRVARLEPEAKLLPQTQFTVRAAPGILDTFGQTLAEPVQRGFVTADASWRDLLIIPGAPGQLSSSSCITIDARGDTWAAWSEPWGSFAIVKLQRFNAAGGYWEPPLLLSPAGFFGQVQLAFDGAGNGVLAWVQPRDMGNWHSPTEVWASRYIASAGLWELPRKLSAPVVEVTVYRSLQLALRADGEAAVAWVRSDLAGYYVEATSARTTSGDWSPPMRVDGGPAPSARITEISLALAPMPAGPMAIAWAEARAMQGPLLRVGLWPRPTQWLPPMTVVDSTPTHSAGAPKLAIDGAGVTHVVWSAADVTQTPSSGSLWVRQCQDFTWNEARCISPAGEASAGFSLAARPHSATPSTWVAWLAAGNRVKAARLRGTGAIEAPQLVGVAESPFAGNDTTSTSVDGAGNLLVAWIERQPIARVVKVARHVGRLSAWQAVRTLDQRDPNALSGAPVRLAQNASGDAVASWQGQLGIPGTGGGFSYPMMLRRFD